jgi:hypothetical protein
MKLLYKKIPINGILMSFFFYWLVFSLFYLAAFFYLLWRLWSGHAVTPHEVVGAYGYYKIEERTGFRKRRKFLINKQILTRH